MQRIAVLTRQPENYSSLRFVEAASKLRGASAGPAPPGEQGAPASAPAPAAGPAEPGANVHGVRLELVDPHGLYLGLTGGRASVARLVPADDAEGPRPGPVAVPEEDADRMSALQHADRMSALQDADRMSADPQAGPPAPPPHAPPSPEPPPPAPPSPGGKSAGDPGEGSLRGRWDFVIPRIGSTATEYALFALRQLELSGVPSLNSYGALVRLRHKFTALSELAAAGLPVPDTMMLRAPGDVGAVVERLGGWPVVLKFIRGSQGVGVVYADNASVAQSVLEALNLISYDVLVQRFYPAAAEGDVRVLVVGDEARWAVRRKSEGGEFRANFHRGAAVSGVEPPAEACALALQAARVFGLGFAGVDLVADGQGGWMVMEVNGSPGFEAAEQIHGRVVAEAVLAHASDSLRA